MRLILSLLFIATLFAFGCSEDKVVEKEMVVEPLTSLEKPKRIWKV